MDLVQPTNLLPQQQHILRQALEHKNLQILALAGCGKTTTSLALATELHRQHGKTTLLLTYNKALQVDTEKRVKKQRMTRYCSVKTIHSAYGFYAGSVANNDGALQRLVDLNAPLQPVNFDVFIIDEAQDLTPLLYIASHRLLQSAFETKGRIQIIVLGDILQRIYGFRNARAEYIMHPERYFDFGEPFERCRLSVNFRCSKKMLDYVNRMCNPECLRNSRLYRDWYLQNEEIISAAWGQGLEPCAQAVSEADMYPDVREVTTDIPLTLAEELGNHIAQGHRDSDICLFGTSCKPQTPMGKIVTRLGVKRNFYFPTSHKSYSTKHGLRKNKITVSTICGMKGREAHHVKVFAPNDWNETKSLTTQRTKTQETTTYDPSDVYNLLYVSVTRGMKTMTVYWMGRKPSFLTHSEDESVNFEKVRVPTSYSVTDLCNHADETYGPLLLDNICTVQNWVKEDTVTCFATPDSRVFAGRVLHGIPSEEDYAPVIGLAVEFGIADAFKLLEAKLPERLHDNYVQLRSSFCECKYCDPACGLSKNKFQEFCSLLSVDIAGYTVNLLDEDFSCGEEDNEVAAMEEDRSQSHQVLPSWDEALQLGVYHYCSAIPQMCRQLVGTHEIERPLLNLCRDRGLAALQRMGTTVEYQQALHRSTRLAQVTGSADFIVDGRIVEVKVTQAITSEHIMQALLYSAMTEQFGEPCYVVAPNLNQVLEISPKPGVTAAYLLEHAIIRKRN